MSHVGVSPTNGNWPTEGQRKTETRGLFLKRPDKFSGPKSHLRNWQPFVLESRSFNMFNFKGDKKKNNCEV